MCMNLKIFGNISRNNDYKGVLYMKIKFNEAGIKKISDGMKKATDKYGLPTKKKGSKSGKN